MGKIKREWLIKQCAYIDIDVDKLIRAASPEGAIYEDSYGDGVALIATDDGELSFEDYQDLAKYFGLDILQFADFVDFT